jgi:hypothetical protein
MYPDGELNRLNAHKMALRARIHVQRAQCVIAAAGAAKPLAWLDRAVVLWNKITPFAKLAALPAAFMFKRTFFPRLKVFSTLLRWGPLAFKVWRGFQAGKKESRDPGLLRRRAQSFR